MLETQNIKVRVGQEPARLSHIADDIWAFRADLKVAGLDLGCCMTVIKLSDGSLLLHSPIEHTKQIDTVLETLGCVKYIVAPNSYHHLFVAPYLEKYDAELFTVEDVARKRPDLDQLTVLVEGDMPPWQEDIEWTIINGKMVQEIVLFHKKSKSLVLTDLAFNVPEPLHPVRLVWHKVMRACGRFSPSRSGVFLFGRSNEVKTKLEEIDQWNFEKIIMAHGTPVTENAKRSFEGAMQVFRT